MVPVYVPSSAGRASECAVVRGAWAELGPLPLPFVPVAASDARDTLPPRDTPLAQRHSPRPLASEGVSRVTASDARDTPPAQRHSPRPLASEGVSRVTASEARDTPLAQRPSPRPLASEGVSRVTASDARDTPLAQRHSPRPLAVVSPSWWKRKRRILPREQFLRT